MKLKQDYEKIVDDFKEREIDTNWKKEKQEKVSKKNEEKREKISKIEKSYKELHERLSQTQDFSFEEKEDLILHLKLARHFQKNDSLDTNVLYDAIIETPKSISKDSGSLNSILEIHTQKTQEKNAEYRKIRAIQSEFYPLLELDENKGEVNTEIVNSFNPEKELDSYKILKEFFRDGNTNDNDKYKTFLAIEREYGINIIPRYNPREALFETSSGNYVLTRLLNKPHLKQESDDMNHCVGTSDSYINQMKKGEIEILSFRNNQEIEDGKLTEDTPILTIEYNTKTGRIEQIKKEDDEYLNLDDPYYEEVIESLQKLQDTFIYDEDGKEKKRRKISSVNTDELGNIKVEQDTLATGRGIIPSSDFEYENDFVLKRGEFTKETSEEQIRAIVNKQYSKEYSAGEIATKAEDITEDTRFYLGDLSPSHVHILENRKNPLEIEGTVNMSGSNISSLPEGTIFHEYADFRNCSSLTSIQKGTIFHGDAYFGNCSSLISLPEGTVFHRNADFGNCSSLSKESIQVLRKLKQEGKISKKLTLPDGEEIE